MDTQIIAANLLRVRKNRGATQEQVAKDSGLSRAAYRAIEKGRSNPKVENLRSIASALSVAVREVAVVSPTCDRERMLRAVARPPATLRVLASLERSARGPRSTESSDRMIPRPARPPEGSSHQAGNPGPSTCAR